VKDTCESYKDGQRPTSYDVCWRYYLETIKGSAGVMAIENDNIFLSYIEKYQKN